MKKPGQGCPPDFGFHRPVLIGEAAGFLFTDPDGTYIDCTVGDGGHAEELLWKLGPGGLLYGLDADSDAIERTVTRLERFGGRLRLLEKNFRDLRDLTGIAGQGSAAGILFDLGLSSWHLENQDRGFSFQKDGPLDMRFSLKQDLTAERIVAEYGKKDLSRIFRMYGELTESPAIAGAIADAREQGKIMSTMELVRILSRRFGHRASNSFLARVFQALRMEVNQELSALKDGLEASRELLKHGGTLVVISYHSLEDRIVKEFIRGKVQERRSILLGTSPEEPFFRVLTPRAVVPGVIEIQENPRARSAKLRAGRRI